LVDDVFKTLNVVFLHGLIDRSSHNGSEKIQINQVGFIPYLKDFGHCSHGLTDKSSGKKWQWELASKMQISAALCKISTLRFATVPC